MKLANQGRNVRATKAKRRNDAQIAGEAAGFARNSGRNCIYPFKEFRRLMQKTLAFIGQRDTFRATYRKANAQPLLHAL
ncbi:hypothetical protein PanNE5_36990 [Pandoraea sp. NE5]|nr:hypothetical protein PanNE5_36990 [Pandoraea sp. NE5]